MQACLQTQNQSIYQHGVSVKEHLFELLDFLRNNKELPGWKLPEWLTKYRSNILNSLLPDAILEEYTTFHDCSKPYCRIVDENGKQHFPDHARLSEQLWLKIGGCKQAATLMGMDMDIHTLKDVGVKEFCDRPQAISLLIVGLCEVHSNSKLFGGLNSESFKIKYKNIDRRGKSICKILFEEQNV